MSEWKKVGSVLRNKDPSKGVYFKVADNVTLTKNTILTMQDPRNRKGITEEQLAKIPDFVRFDVFLPPSDN